MTKTEDLRHIIDAMRGASVLVIGDIMLDRYFYGSVSRISPEAPVPVLHVKREGRMLGGAGNVLRNLDGLGVKSKIVTLIGDDSEGAIVRTMLNGLEHSSEEDHYLVESTRPTTVKSRFVAQGQQLLRADEEDKSVLPESLQSELIANFDAHIDGCGAVILSDYDKGVLSEKVITHILKVCCEKNIKTLVDPKGTNYSIYDGAYVVTPNRDELSRATSGHATIEDGDVVKAAIQLIEHDGIQNVVATRSEDGMTIVQGYEDTEMPRPVHIPTQALEVYDVSGAGDTVIATIAASLAANSSLVDAARLANIAGGVVVAKTGTAQIYADELVKHIENYGEQDVSIQINPDHDSTSKASIAHICDWDDAKKKMEAWQRHGLKVGLTNGCFDLLHPGHVEYLHEARMLCDRLVVALNRDVSVKLLKGADRPVQDEQARARVLGALAAVDMVVFFGAEAEGEDNTAAKLITQLQPDIYVKGGDYTLDEIPEVPFVTAYGGEARVLSLVNGHSTSGSIAKIRKA